jgi:hypothetical protein
METRLAYDSSVKKRPSGKAFRTPGSGGAKKLHALKKCLRELQSLYTEAATILDDLLRTPPAEIIRELCARFRIIQEYFAMRYEEARAYAVSALGRVEAAISFP